VRPVHTFHVVPALPEKLGRLLDLAYNLRWAWNHDTIELFRRLDSDLWETVYHNPVKMLGAIAQERLEKAAEDDAFLAHLERASADMARHLDGEPTWFGRNYGKTDPPLVAYFSAEFGITESLSIFAGGLGVLAGDHLKSASDLGVPIVAVGLLYQQGYFRQHLNAAGWQQEGYEDNDFLNLPVKPMKGVTVTVHFPGREVVAQVWKAQVGRVSLYLLDTNLGVNRPEDRDVTDQLYGGDLDMRLRQEILLGIGGRRALVAMGLKPTVYHMNEGHAAFLALERIRGLMTERGLSFAEAREIALMSQVFTTHTPVPAGHDYFPADLMDRYFGEYYSGMGLSRKEFLGLGRRNANDDGEKFCMTVLAMRLSAFRNGVSELHGQVSRQMWKELWPGVPEAEVPIGHVTNGVHFRSWISYEMNQLYDRYLGPNWRHEPGEMALWRRVDSIPPEELWRTHERRRERLVAFARKRLHTQLKQRGAPQADVDAAEEALDAEALTIGFARRFATYKRATLLFRDVERLGKILNNKERPVQFIFAGKAHPKDDAGKQLIQKIVSLANREEFRHRLVFLEDYDMAVARYLVQGCDVWLNTPQRPQEASGTSGMKALANGVLNLSTLDGWWDEAWRFQEPGKEPVGWAIGRGEEYADAEYQSAVESEMLYRLLEGDVVPTYYDRGRDGLPRRWIGRMKSSIGALCPVFNTHRMVREYTECFYLVAHAGYRKLTVEGAAGAKRLAAWADRVKKEWDKIRVEVVPNGTPDELKVGDKLHVQARVELGGLAPEDVLVQLCVGPLNSQRELEDSVATVMAPLRAAGPGVWLFEAREVCCEHSGQHGFTVRVLPYHADASSAFIPGLIRWA
jgi:glycogen phosphorylase